MIIKLLIPTVFLVLFFSSCSSTDDKEENQEKKELIKGKKITKLENNTLEMLSQSFINSLKEKNFKPITVFLPSKKDIEDIVMVYDGTDEDRKKILAESKKNSKKIEKNTRKAFDDILKKGEDVGITWESVEFSKAEYSINPQNNINYASLTISFKYKVLTYKLTIAECIKTERGWLIFDKPKWKG